MIEKWSASQTKAKPGRISLTICLIALAIQVIFANAPMVAMTLMKSKWQNTISKNKGGGKKELRASEPAFMAGTEFS